MPFIDMPLDQLKTYQGRNPRPADFDDFWDRSPEEMRSLKAEVEIIPADFRSAVADSFHLYFTGVGGSRVYAKLLRPKSVSAPHPADRMRTSAMATVSGSANDRRSAEHSPQPLCAFRLPRITEGSFTCHSNKN